ncbi:TetR/AcrR family transcriptional regulator [Kineosporia babensis]|uniref:TetR/AcrR family transcriptional regulator n=1 Tax=Kineosporia babensis TaxID=499548 RepID=A0A9X1NCG7_9ACTN|nr:TetR/AcrR family transcriptional regulator [Kineosporia babensis]MCD5310503.1 TetR/AcrR family transcriptional regulator [Kineosporia babensis]
MPAAATRRAQYAALTRQAILDAARALFIEHGYFGTKVEQIAAAAQVAPATVYAVGGGKNGLLRTLIETAVNSPENADLRGEIEAADDPQLLLQLIVDAAQSRFDRWAPLLRQVIAAAPQEAGVRESLGIAHESLRQGLRLAAERLAAQEALRAGLDAGQATDLLWLYLCNTACFVRADDLGWSSQRSRDWLNTVLVRELLER